MSHVTLAQGGDVAFLGEFRDHDQGYARAVVEEAHRLHISRVVVAAALVKRDENGGVIRVGRRLHLIDDLLDEAFEQVELRGGRGTLRKLCCKRVILI